jgi:hypothetical protein
MLGAFLEHPFFLHRHRQALRLKERESFLNHLQPQGTSRKALRNLSAELLQVVRFLKLTEMRDVSLEEIERAACGWARQERANPKAHSYGPRLHPLYMRLKNGCDSMANPSFRELRRGTSSTSSETGGTRKPSHARGQADGSRGNRGAVR